MKSSNGHFEFWNLNGEGETTGTPTKILSEVGLVLNCHNSCDAQQVEQLAAIARKTPDYPVDITAWSGPPNDRRMVWWARIYWRGQQ